MPDPEKSKPKHPLLRTVIAALVLGAMFQMNMAAVGLVYVGLYLLLWIPVSLYQMVRKPEIRKVQSLKIGIWFLMIAVVLGIHQFRKVNTRNFANSLVQKIEGFKKQQGRYPDSLEEVGISQTELDKAIVRPRYSNQPRLYYPDTFMIFHVWRYDFEKHEWVNEGD